MTILVTGGAGFIGCNLVRRLQSDGADDVRILDNFSTGFEENLSGVDVEIHRGSILDEEALARAAKGAEAIVHLAARPSVPRSIADPMASHQANATGTLMVLEAARREEAHVVLASSSSVYGANPTLPKNEDLRPMPVSPYAVSKLATEAYALSYQSVYGLTVLPFRFFNVYGPWQRAGHAYAAVVPQFVSQALAGLPLTVHGDGEQSRDFTFVDTVTETLSLAARERISSPDPVNLAFGTRHTLLDVISRLETILGTPLTVEHVEPRAGDVRHSQADQSRLRELVASVTPVDLDTGLAGTVEWMKRLNAPNSGR
ncbi:NAD-dependent epimerase/dehydratase family protein [Propionibacteriaceae bacterium Y1685]|uniref:NAD-dependent epimerase/dehydratase family protein n=1 Tax=Microlunatus sp. Y1700 TaxID=3418487 RepID=UPI003B8182DD